MQRQEQSIFIPPPFEDTLRVLLYDSTRGIYSYQKFFFFNQVKLTVVFFPPFFPLFFKVTKSKYSTSLPYHKIVYHNTKTVKLTSRMRLGSKYLFFLKGKLVKFRLIISKCLIFLFGDRTETPKCFPLKKKGGRSQIFILHFFR